MVAHHTPPSANIEPPRAVVGEAGEGDGHPVLTNRNAAPATHPREFPRPKSWEEERSHTT